MKLNTAVRVGWCGGSWNASGVGEMACAALTSARLYLLYLLRAEKKLLTEASTELWLFRLMAVAKALPGHAEGWVLLDPYRYRPELFSV